MAKWLRIKDATIRQAFEELVGLLKKGGGGEIGVDKQARAIAAEAASKAKKANDNALTAIQKAADTEAALDGKITTYYQTEPPSGDLAIGDLWFDTDDDNKPYRWDGSQWVEVRDQKVIAAYNEALDAKATADSKIVTYYQDNPPTNPSYGDLWFDTDDQNKPYRYDGSNWVEVRDQKSVEAFNLANDAKATADGKITTYYQNDAPINADYGDLWFDTDDQNKLYRYDGSNWVEVRDQKVIDAYNKALNAESIANTKITTYYQTTAPSGASEGDLWVDTDDKNRLYRWNGSAWELISDTWVQDAVNQAQYTFADLQTDLKKGVSVVFKDISEFDANYPSAIAIGNITLNQDGTVSYGSRGVAITKNGLAGFDDSYNGAGDLPSFSIDTNGNVYLRGEIHAQSGSFAGELVGASGTFGEITSGIMRNDDNTAVIDLNTNNGDFIRFGTIDNNGVIVNGVKMTGYDLIYYRNGTAVKSLRKIASGTANSGDTVTLTGFYDREPSILVSPSSTPVFDGDHNTSDQTLNVYAKDLSGDTGSGEWSFKVQASLDIGESERQVSRDVGFQWKSEDSSTEVRAGSSWGPDMSNFDKFDASFGIFLNGNYVTKSGSTYYYYHIKLDVYVRLWGSIGTSDVQVLVDWQQVATDLEVGYSGSYRSFSVSFTDVDNVDGLTNVSVAVKCVYKGSVGGASTSRGAIPPDSASVYFSRNLPYKFADIGFGNCVVLLKNTGGTQLLTGTLNWIAIG